MLRDGRVKATKVGREWRFPKEALMKIFDLPATTIADYRPTIAGAGRVGENIAKYDAKRKVKTGQKKTGEKDDAGS
jgi:hypothetical protein